ncbi:3-hydroxy-3-methylglutaryl-coenzyme A reductase [Trichonephila inaurata madagascariensis]|uniref:3-hydroxy-3-methylglutaryl coenzyme A reductase n=1 Tax=Trichonephila inaurata madagascariensis TaxID=2747483 RepID=A0A8X7C051_9ARAC|nr:3-hydroxy-3-methylglutaryl-coenzyme A reductase [Trichonephila inaurata madagascariensis]
MTYCSGQSNIHSVCYHICFIALGKSSTKVCGHDCSEENKGVELVLLSIARCVAILFFIHPFLKLNKLGSTFLVVIGGVFTLSCLISCFVFSINLVTLLAGDFTELNKALPFYFLLMDITNAGLLAQFALSSSTQEEVRENIAQGMSIIGPTITLDTIVKTLVIGVGTLSGVRRLEELCRFACMSAVINYFVFMLFFPACLALILELSRNQDEGRPVWYFSTLSRILQEEEEQKPNPVLQRVKLIMSAGLLLVHAHSRYPVLIAGRALQQASKSTLADFPDQPSNWDLYMQRFGSAEQMVLVTLACTIAILYHYFISHEDLSEHLAAANSSPSRRPPSYRNNLTSQTVQTNFNEGLNRNQELIQTSASEAVHAVSFKVGGEEMEHKRTIKTVNKMVQTEAQNRSEIDSENEISPEEPRSIEECREVLKSEVGGTGLIDDEVIMLAEKKIIPIHALETVLRNPKRGVFLRRKLISKLSKQESVFDALPYLNYNYKMVMGSCCENVIGYVPIPAGIAGPLLLDDELLYIPMATTEGCLVASTNRGCRALTLSGGVRSTLLSDGMTRAPVVRLPTEREAGMIKLWLEERKNFEILKAAFDSTSRFARLQAIEVQTAGPLAFLRFKATTGDAMGMNMLSKGVDIALNKLCDIFPNVKILSLSGNYCTDKKPAAVNWIRGRGKEIVCGAQIPAKIVKEVLKTDVHSLVNLNITKNYIGSAMAGSVGGFNSQAANIVTAIFLATGQDPAQNVTSSNCITQLEVAGPEGKDLYICCTMPSIEVGTVGGGTFLPAQSSCLELLGVKGSCDESPGKNAAKLARVVCATVLAGELSLLAALVEGHLVRSHMTHNRSSTNIQSTPAQRPSENLPIQESQST